MEAGSGERLGRYVLTRRLGAGGMAEVFEAVDELLRRRVAVKVVRGPLSESGEFTTRFLREARLAAQLRHPNVVPIYDVGVDRGVLFVVMPVLGGGTLSDRVLPGVADVTALDWLSSLASALDYAHGKGVIHRDVKPQNVLFDDEGGLQLSDFGLARSLEETTQLTQTGAVLGTPVYMSPEQINGSGVGPGSDQYALAILAFRLLTGRLPIEKVPAPVIFQRTLFEPLPPPSTFRPGLPAGVDDAIERALAKRPADRFPSCTAFVERLAAALAPSAGLGPRDVPTTLLSRDRRPTLPPTVAVAPPSRPYATPRSAVTPRPPERPPPAPSAPPSAERQSPLPLPGVSRTVWSASSTGASTRSFPWPVVVIGFGLALALALAVGVALARRSGAGALRNGTATPPPTAPAALPQTAPPTPLPAIFAPDPSPAATETPTPPPLDDVVVVEVVPSPTFVPWTLPAPPRPQVLTARASAPTPVPTLTAAPFPTARPYPTWPPTATVTPWPTVTPSNTPTPTSPAPTPSATPRPTAPPAPADPLASVPRRRHAASLHLETAVLRVERSAYVIALEFSEDLDSEEKVGYFATLRVTTRGGSPLLLSADGLSILACEGLSGKEVTCEIRRSLTRFDEDEEELTEDDQLEVRGVVGGFAFSGTMSVED